MYENTFVRQPFEKQDRIYYTNKANGFVGMVSASLDDKSSFFSYKIHLIENEVKIINTTYSFFDFLKCKYQKFSDIERECKTNNRLYGSDVLPEFGMSFTAYDNSFFVRINPVKGTTNFKIYIYKEICYDYKRVSV